jgi:hypothetical protein
MHENPAGGWVETLGFFFYLHFYIMFADVSSEIKGPRVIELTREGDVRKEKEGVTYG